MKFSHKSGIIKTVPKHNNKWSMAYIGKSYKDGKDIMVEFAEELKRQNDGIKALKEILIDKCSIEDLRKYYKWLDEKFERQIMQGLNWDSIIVHFRMATNESEVAMRMYNLLTPPQF